MLGVRVNSDVAKSMYKLIPNNYNCERITFDMVLCSFCNKTSKRLTAFFCINNGVQKKESYLCMSCEVKKLLDITTLYMYDYEEVLTLTVLCKSFSEKKKREPIGLSKRYSVLKKANFKCQGCGVSASNAKIEIDHIIPVSKGGSSFIKNLQALCFDCNRGKGANL